MCHSRRIHVCGTHIRHYVSDTGNHVKSRTRSQMSHRVFGRPRLLLPSTSILLPYPSVGVLGLDGSHTLTSDMGRSCSSVNRTPTPSGPRRGDVLEKQRQRRNEISFCLHESMEKEEKKHSTKSVPNRSL